MSAAAADGKWARKAPPPEAHRPLHPTAARAPTRVLRQGQFFWTELEKATAPPCPPCPFSGCWCCPAICAATGGPPHLGLSTRPGPTWRPHTHTAAAGLSASASASASASDNATETNFDSLPSGQPHQIRCSVGLETRNAAQQGKRPATRLRSPSRPSWKFSCQQSQPARQQIKRGEKKEEEKKKKHTSQTTPRQPPWTYACCGRPTYR